MARGTVFHKHILIFIVTMQVPNSYVLLAYIQYVTYVIGLCLYKSY